MNIHKTSEKLLIWMKRNKITQQSVADQMGITRQTLIARMKDNTFQISELIKLQEMGFDD